jgi:hypothetical protein
MSGWGSRWRSCGVLGLIPALAWPYWLVNVALAVLFGALWWRSRKAAALND